MGNDTSRLVERARLGDQSAFGALVKGHHDKVRAVLLGIVRNPQDADDLAQQTWIKAWRNLPGFEGKSSFSTWLFRIATFTAWDHLKKRKRLAEVEFAEELHTRQSDRAALTLTQPTRPDRAAAHTEIMERFEAALETLSHQHRTSLVLREVEGMSYKEIAAVTDCNIGTVMSRIYTARKSIQAYMKDLL
jgi:RNA polymerase sigma-70 factor (ECF subfamily)